MSESEEDGSLTGCTLVIPTNCSASLYFEAHDLANKIVAKTGVSITVRYDSERFDRQEGDLLVLLGAVDYAVMREEMRDFRAMDYFCRENEDTLLLGGKSDEATVLAIRRFSEELLPHATASELLLHGGGFTVRGEYACGPISLNGFDLNEYTIVYPKKQKETLKELAFSLRDRLSDAVGYYLNVQTEEEYKEEGRVIRLALTSSEESSDTAYLIPEERGLTLAGENAFGVSVAILEWIDRLSGTPTKDSREVTVAKTESISHAPALTRVASLQPSVFSFSAISNLTSVLAPVRGRVPDVLLLSSVSEQKIGLLYENLNEYWKIQDNDAALRHELREVCWEEALGAYRVGDETYGFLILFAREEALNEALLTSLGEKTRLPIVVLCHGKGEGARVSLSDASGVGLVFRQTYEGEGKSTWYFACYATEGAFEIASGEVYAAVGYADLTITRRYAWY